MGSFSRHVQMQNVLINTQKILFFSQCTFSLFRRLRMSRVVALFLDYYAREVSGTTDGGIITASARTMLHLYRKGMPGSKVFSHKIHTNEMFLSKKRP